MFIEFCDIFSINIIILYTYLYKYIYYTCKKVFDLWIFIIAFLYITYLNYLCIYYNYIFYYERTYYVL